LQSLFDLLLFTSSYGILGYKKYYRQLNEYLTSHPSLRGKIVVVPLEDRGTTGNFDVTVIETGQILHSKKMANQGRAESQKERDAIVEQLVEILD